MSNSIASNRSTLKEFLASIATIQGDLSNITAPPFVLGQYSTVELPQYWADHPSLFVAPALEDDAEKRAILVLKWFLGSLRNQQYAGRREEDGVKKPLNAFLGELFLGGWKDEDVGETKLVSEQVSHHPPVTACYLWNDKHGIRAEGFTQQEITFSGSVSIKQKGYALLHIDRYEEDYLIPVPNVKVKGILGGTPYPELVGKYSTVSTTGFVSDVKFEGKGFLGGGQKNGFEARVYHRDSPSDSLYTGKGQWNGNFSIHDNRTGNEVDAFDINAQKSYPITVAPQLEQDSWESRHAWGGVIDALGRGDMKGTVDAKSRVEEGQRQMRRDEERDCQEWPRVFFQKEDRDALFEQLSAAEKDSFTVDPAGGIWKLDKNAIENAKRPYHGDKLPTAQTSEDPQVSAKGEVHHPEEEQAINEAVYHSHHESNGSVPAPTSPAKDAEKATESNGTVQASKGLDGDLDVDKMSDLQVEEMLRHKYSSAPR